MEFEKLIITATSANSWNIENKVPAKNNAEIVEKFVSISKYVDREVADPSEARKIIGI